MHPTGFEEKLPGLLPSFFVSRASRSCVFRLITARRLVSGAPAVISISGNFSLRTQTQLARLFANSGGEVRICAASAHACGKMAIRRAAWCRDCVRSERGDGVAGS